MRNLKDVDRLQLWMFTEKWAIKTLSSLLQLTLLFETNKDQVSFKMSLNFSNFQKHFTGTGFSRYMRYIWTQFSLQYNEFS